MNAKTAKLIRRYCRKAKLHYAGCKQFWATTPRARRHWLRTSFKEYLGD